MATMRTYDDGCARRLLESSQRRHRCTLGGFPRIYSCLPVWSAKKAADGRRLKKFIRHWYFTTRNASTLGGVGYRFLSRHCLSKYPYPPPELAAQFTIDLGTI